MFLSSADEAGKQIADAQSETVAQIDRAYDAAAQGTIGRAVVVAQSLHAEQGSFTTDLATLSALRSRAPVHVRSVRTAPTTVSYAVSGSEFGAAVRSESGTCWWVKIDASSVTTYGSGTPVHGERRHGRLRRVLVAPPDRSLSLRPQRRYERDGRLLRLPDHAAAAPRVDPWMVKAAVVRRRSSFSGSALFARWVVASERDELRARPQTSPSGADDVRTGSLAPDPSDTDAEAEEATAVALAAARPRSRSVGSFLAAGPAAG